MTDNLWKKLELKIKTGSGRVGTIDNRKFIESVLWVLRTGTRWEDLPDEYGNKTNIMRRFYRWRNKGAWKPILEILLEDPNYQWLTNNETPRYGGALSGHLWPWMRLFNEKDLLPSKQDNLPPKLAQQIMAR